MRTTTNRTLIWIAALIAVGAMLASLWIFRARVDGPRVGAWQLTGEDTNGQTWTATFRLRRTNTTYSGNFVWKRNGADAGEEEFTGAYDATKKIITLRGTRTSGNLFAATYIAGVSSDLSRMTDGRWMGPGPSGTWRADRVAD